MFVVGSEGVGDVCEQGRHGGQEEKCWTESIVAVCVDEVSLVVSVSVVAFVVVADERCSHDRYSVEWHMYFAPSGNCPIPHSEYLSDLKKMHCLSPFQCLTETGRQSSNLRIWCSVIIPCSQSVPIEEKINEPTSLENKHVNNKKAKESRSSIWKGKSSVSAERGTKTVVF